jgi:hypothetical protein
MRAEAQTVVEVALVASDQHGGVLAQIIVAALVVVGGELPFIVPILPRSVIRGSPSPSWNRHVFGRLRGEFLGRFAIGLAELGSDATVLCVRPVHGLKLTGW